MIDIQNQRFLTTAGFEPGTFRVRSERAKRRAIGADIYRTPKETIQSCLLYYFIKCNYMAFLHLVKVVRDVFENNTKFEPGAVKRNFCRSI